MGRRRTRPELVDLLTDSDEETLNQPSTSLSQVQKQVLQAERSDDHIKMHNWLLKPLSTYTKGRVHRFTDLENGINKEHYIPDDQLECRGCSIEPFELKPDMKEVTDKKKNTGRPTLGADPKIQARNADAQGGDRNGSKLLDADGPGATTASDKGKSNDRPRRQKVLDIIEYEGSTASHTEAGSDNEEVQIIPGPSQQTPSHLRSQPGRDRKGKQRERLTEIDLSQLSDDDDAPSPLSRSGRAISLIGDANELDDEDYRRAVALSLQDAAVLDAGKSTPSGSNSNEGSDDEDLKRAIALSLKDAENEKERALSGKDSARPIELQRHQDSDTTLSRSPPETIPSDSLPAANTQAAPLAPSLPTVPHTQSSGTTSSSAFNIFGLNRKQMEEERLARLKRKHDGDSGNGQTSKALRLDASGSLSQSTRISPPPLQRQIRQLPTSIPSSGPSRRPTSQQRRNISPPLATSAASSRSAQQGETATAIPTTSSASSTLPLFPRGKVYKTALSKSDTDTNTISFPSLLGPTTALESALLSSFIWDFDWLFPHFDTKSTKFQLVMHGKSPAQRDAIKSDFQGVNNVRICFPPMDGIVNCMHSKLMLLFYKAQDGAESWSRRCRLVIPTANLVGFDWGVGSFMENSVFLIDLPAKADRDTNKDTSIVSGEAAKGMDVTSNARDGRATATKVNSSSTSSETPKESPSPVAISTSVKFPVIAGFSNNDKSTSSIMGTGQGTETEFERSLRAFLTAQTIPADVLLKLSGFDFSQTDHLGFVHTIGGMHMDQTRTTTGLYGLSRTVTHLGLATQRPIEMDYVTSSLGNLNDEFMTCMYRAAQGDLSSSDSPPCPRAAKKTSASRHNQAEDRRQERQREWWKNSLRIYYPSDTTVRRSKGGARNAGTICFSSKWWGQGTFPRSNMRDCVSVREGMLMHNKVSGLPFFPHVK